jgi:ABC-type uncharacterized transport system YnjBCD substrate-binding protein
MGSNNRKETNKMNLTELVNQNRDLLTTIATNHSFAERLNAMASLPMELQRYLLDDVTITLDDGRVVPAPTVDKAAQKLLNLWG